MRTPASVVAGVDFGDPEFAARVRDGVARVEDLMSTELGKADVLMAEAVQHLFQAGGKRFRPLFTVLAGSLGPRPENPEITIAGAVSSWSTWPRCTTTTSWTRPRCGAARTAQRPLGQQHRHPGRRIPVRHRVAAGVPARPDAVRVIADTFAQWSPARCGRPAGHRGHR
jgi:hypothetical protein